MAGKLEFPRHFETHARDLIRKLLTADRTKRIGAPLTPLPSPSPSTHAHATRYATLLRIRALLVLDAVLPRSPVLTRIRCRGRRQLEERR